MFPYHDNIYNILVVSIIVCILSVGCGNQNRESQTGPEKEPGCRDSLISALQHDRYNLEINEELWRFDTRKFDFDSVLHYAIPCYQYSLETSDRDIQLHSGMFISQAYLFKSMTDSMFMYLNPISPLVEKTDMTTMKLMYNNIMGIYYMGFSMDINKAIEHLYQSLNYALDIGNIRSCSAVMSNIVYAYFLRNDPEGISYALKMCELGKENDDDYVSYLGALSASHMYYLKNDYEKALEFIQTTEYLMNKIGTKNYTIYPLYAEILFSLGGKENIARGEDYINLALENVSYMDNASQIYTYLAYGKHLHAKGKHKEAIQALNTGISKTYTYCNFSMYTKMFMTLTDIYRELGMEDKANESALKYRNTRDSLFNVDNERMFNNLRFRFESEKLNNIIQSQQIVILERKREQEVLILIVIIILVMLLMTLIMYKRTNAMYKKLAAQYDNFKMKQEMKEESDKNKNDVEKTITDKTEKYHELYEKLMILVRNDKIYKRKDISMDTLATMLSTNKSYLSRMFSHYHTSFNGFINSYRIKECTTILSDHSSDINLKELADRLGYNSMSSFYRAFLNETGVPPAQYRKHKRSSKNQSIFYQNQ